MVEEAQLSEVKWSEVKGKNLFKQCILIFVNFQLSNLISWILHDVANLATGLPTLTLSHSPNSDGCSEIAMILLSKCVRPQITMQHV
jgi:hypothetical protein